MQKILILLIALLPLAASAQKPVVQQSAYIGLGGANFLSLGYEARFRNFNKKPDYALGLGIIHGTFGIRPSASVLFGKGSSAFELGLNSSIIFYSNAGIDYYSVASAPYTQTSMFLGYRLQPKNHRFFLQLQCAPLTLGTSSQRAYKYDPSTQSYKQIPGETITTFNTVFAKNPKYTYTSFFPFELRLGINLNRLKDTTTENTAYEAPKNAKLPLQHGITAGLNFSVGGAIPIAYDLRWRRPQKVDFAGNINLKTGTFNYYNITPELQLLALFGEGNASLEAGIGANYVSYQSVYASRNQPDYVQLGVPLGFRYQPPKGFFMRIYAMPYRSLLPIIPNTSPYYSPNIPPLISGVSLSTNFGYTF
jgi:hypothetical protein